jgi:hypothetical protein
VDYIGSPFFSGAVALLNSVDDCAKGCHVRGLPVGSVRMAYMNWRGKRMYHVGRVFELLRLSDMSNRLFVAAIK